MKDILWELVCRLVGKVAADNSHKWVFKESDPTIVSSWNMPVEPVR